MFDAAVPIILFAVLALMLPIAMLAAGRLLGPRRHTPVKAMPYESGMDPVHDTRRRFDVRFNLLAIDFLVFDVELLFLYPWAVAARHQTAGIDWSVSQMLIDGRLTVFGGVVVFIALLILGFVYTWKKGVFEWR